MEHLHHARVAEQVVERGKVQSVGQGVDQHRIGFAIARIGKLDQAEFGVIRPFAQKFGVDRDVGGFGGARAVGGEGVGGGERDDLRHVWPDFRDGCGPV